ncbi:MAG: DUF1385 domain-containing protein [Lachnospiraceae bacterium]
MKSSNIGGQAVIEGIMMKNGDAYAVAVRKQNGEIVLQREDYNSIIKWKKLTKIPFIRGVFNFIDSMVLGMKTLTYSASFFEEEEEVLTTAEQKEKKEKQEKFIMGATVAFSIVLAIGIFMVLPYFLSGLLSKTVTSQAVRAIIEGVVRLLIFVGYVLLISQMKDIKRVFMYHGAEHKCINCIETGKELTVENVRNSSKQHKRCGTSFLLFVMLVSIILFFFIRVDSPVLRVVIRIALVPVIAGISYELIKWAGNSDNPIVGVLSKPGLWLQKLTTKEPEDDMIEVAIEAVESVFDWKQYLENSQQEV